MNSQLKERIQAIFTLFIMAGAVGVIGYEIYVHRDKTSPLVNKNWCSEVIYYDSKKKTIDTTYCKSLLFGDTLLNFTDPSGKIWNRKDMIDFNDNEIDYGTQWDITLINGQHFKVTPISDTACLIKSKMDSLKENNIPNDDTDNN